jgi:uncharacterized phage protein (TIGR02218 family)
MQDISEDLMAHLDQEVTTLATCWKIIRVDTVAYYYTDHDRDLVIEGNTYKAASLMSPSAVTSQLNLATDNLELEGMLTDDGLREDDILSGKFDHARITIFAVNYEDISAGKLALKHGLIGEVSLKNGLFVAEIRGLSSVLQQTIGEVYTPTCRAKLGDGRCGINLVAFTVSGMLTAVEGAHAFTDASRTEDNDYFAYGIVTFTSGNNAGLSMEIRQFSSQRFSLFLPMPYAVEVGDSYTAIAGCDKRFDTCITRFSNAVNFRGEPHVPGTDKMMQTAATRTS